MNKKETKFTEQEAPLKNTDKAFVKVSREKNAQPEAPAKTREDGRNGQKGEPEEGTLRHR